MGVSEGCGLPGADDGDSYQWDDAHSTHQIAGNQRELLSQLWLVLIYEYTQTHNGSYHTQPDKAGQILISFTARFTLFPTLFSPPIHTLKQATHPLTVRECLEEHILAVSSVPGHGASPDLDQVAGPWPQTLQNHTGRLALHHWAVQQSLGLKRRRCVREINGS